MSKKGQIRVLVFILCFFMIGVLWSMFFDNTVQAAHRPCFSTHTCWKNHTYVDGHTTVNGTVVVPAKTPTSTHSTHKNTTIKKGDKSGKKGLEDRDSDESTSTVQSTASDDDSGYSDSSNRSNRDKLGPYYLDSYSEQDTSTVNAPVKNTKHAFLFLKNDKGEIAVTCVIQGCITEVTALENNGVYVIIKINNDTYNLLVMNNNGTYVVTSSNIYILVMHSKDSYSVYLY